MSTRLEHRNCQRGCKREVPFAVAFREAIPKDDTGFVAHSWVESFHKGSLDMKLVRFGRYRGPMFRRIATILNRSLVLVAFEPSEPSHLLGWVAAEKDGELAVIHYVYVLHTRRDVGLASALIREAFERLRVKSETWLYTHPTYIGARLANRVGHGGEYNPCFLWETKTEKVA